MPQIDAKTALDWVRSGQARLIDVREPAEFAALHIQGAQSMPLSTFSPAALAPKPGEKLIMVCATGRRSTMACEKLAGSSLDAYTLSAGLEAYGAAGGSLISSAKKVLPLERQVLIGAGTLVLLGVILSQMLHPGFLALSAFVGAGLVFAGLTGFCGMALILARAPWNQRLA
jgi:rhodanese-related sulfurtransferase